MAITNSPVTGTMKYLTIGENTYELAGSSGSGNGTVTSVGVSNATNGGLSISGSPITTSGSITIGHSNVLNSAQSTQGVYPITIDKNGHIASYGSAVDISSETLVVNVTATVGDDETVYTADKTYSEILAAINSEKVISLRLTDLDGIVKELSFTSYLEEDDAIQFDIFPDYRNTFSLVFWINGNITSMGGINVPQITLNGSETLSPSFYAPISAGTNDYILKSNGSGAPSWTSAVLTDENVKVTSVSSGTNYYPTFTDAVNTTTGTLKSNNYFKYSIDSSTSYIDLGSASLKGKIRLSNTASGNTVRFTKIQPSGTADRTITLPDATGTVALTSDIPTVPTNISSFTNDSGYTTNTGTVTSVGVSNATNGGLTISGSPITGSGSITVGHTNVLTNAQTTQALYPIKIDKNGHISAYGTAVTSLPASDVSSWAKASSKPSYTASEVSAVALSDKYTRSSFGDLGWSNQSEGDSKVIAKSALAFWDGSYLETVTGESSDVYSSNLWRCKTGGIVGSYQASATTVADLLTQLRYKNGSMGSVNIGTAYTLNGTTIPTGWYNFMYSPHRWGGNQNASSAAYRDNTDYGMLLLASMTNENGIFWIRFSSGAIANAKSLLTNDIVMYNRGTSSDTITLTAGTVTQIVLNNQLINTNTNLYSISDGGIKVGCAGYYRVTAGAYFGTATATYQADVFVHKIAGSYSNNVSYEIGSGRDCIATTYGGNPEPQFTKIVSASKNQVFYLSVRATGGSGTNVYPGNKMTFLQIQCLGS